MILDIVVGILIVISGFIGIKKGMVNIIVKFVGVILAIALSYMFYEKLAIHLNEKYMWKEKIATSVKNIMVQDNTKEENLEQISETIEDNDEKTEDVEENKIEEILVKFNLTSKINIKNEKEKVEVESSKTLSDVISEKIAGYVLNIAAFLIIFVAISLIVAIVELVLALVFMVPGLKQINKAGGFIVQVILSLVKLCIVLQIVKIMSPLEFMSGVNNIISGSIVVRFIYEHNILTGIISNIKL